MKLTQRLLVLLITVTMLLSGSFVQVFATEEAADNGSVVVSETADSEDTEEAKEEAKEEVKEEAKEEAKEEVKEDKTKESDAGEAAPKKEEPKAETKTNEEADTKAEPEKEAKAEDENKNEGEAEDAEEAKSFSAGELTYACDDYTVTLEYSKNAEIPEGTKLEVREVLADSDSKKERKEYEEYYDISLEQLRSEKGGDAIAKLGFAKFYDITLISKGKEIEPKGDVSVKFEFSKDSREKVDKKDDAEKNLRVVHLTENEKTGELEAAAIDKKDTDMSLEKKELTETSFTTDSFSVYGIVYTVDFEYEGYTFSIEGESDVLISELFERLHIEEDASKVQNVEFTDPKLIKVEQVKDDWKLTSLKPFDTEEKLTITLPDKIIEIKVTDARPGYNTFRLYRNREAWILDDFKEVFNTVVLASRAGVPATQVADQETLVDYDLQDGYGWKDFDYILEEYCTKYSYDGSKGRYSVVSARDAGTGRGLCAVGLNGKDYDTVHGTFGLLKPQGSNIATTGNGSENNYDLEITLNDNSLPVRINVNGGFIDTIYLNTNTGSHDAREIADYFGYKDYAVESATIDGNHTSRVTLTELSKTTRLSGNSYHADSMRVRAGIEGNFSFDSFDCLYPSAYKWTYGSDDPESAIDVKDNPYIINLVEPIARVSTDGENWTYHAYLITPPNQEDGGSVKIGAFNQANSLTGDVIVEMLYDTHERYTLSSGFNFNNTGISSLTINGTGNKTTLVKDQTNSTIVPMITTTGINNVEVNKIIFDGNNQITTNGHGGGLKTNAKSLTVNDCEFKDCQAGYQGGGISHTNTGATVSISSTTFNNCRANGPDDNRGAGGGGLFTDALTLTVTSCIFDGCTTKERQGAGLFHKRTNDTEASSTTVTESTFRNCTSVWSGGGMEADARDVTIKDTTFTNCQATDSGGGKGGAINVWSNGENNTTKASSLTVSGCTFGGEDPGDGCTAKDNAGAIRSTALNNVIEKTTFNNCSAAKNGGAIAFTNDKTTTSIEIKNCSFDNCTAGKNGGAYNSVAKSTTTISETNIDKCSAQIGGAISSGTLTVNGGTISNCSATSGNGGAIRGEAAVTINGGTISDCSATGDGGAIHSKGLTVSSGTISDCSASGKGGAAYSTATIIMTGGTVTGCTTGGDSAALDAATGQSGLTFSGNVKVEGNTGSGGEARDVYLGTNTDRHILVAGTGLGDNASIGIYVADANSAFDNHGKPNQMFAWVGRNSGNPKAVDYNNLDKFFSDRLDNGEMHGVAAVEGSGANWEYRIMWSTEEVVAPTNVNLRMMPYILILLGGAALVILKKTADRRRRSEDDTYETEE